MIFIIWIKESHPIVSCCSYYFFHLIAILALILLQPQYLGIFYGFFSVAPNTQVRAQQVVVGLQQLLNRILLHDLLSLFLCFNLSFLLYTYKCITCNTFINLLKLKILED